MGLGGLQEVPEQFGCSRGRTRRVSDGTATELSSDLLKHWPSDRQLKTFKNPSHTPQLF